MGFQQRLDRLLSMVVTGAVLSGLSILPAYGDTKLVPSMSVSERYDSNVFFGLAGADVDPADYVSSFSPQLRVDHKNRFIEGDLTGGITGEVYAKNPGLNYIGTNVGIALNLDGIVKRFLPSASLQLMDRFTYTPQPPAFLAPNLLTPGLPLDPQTAFARGIQSFRVNSKTNVGTVNASYVLSPSTSLRAIYSNSWSQFGSAFAASPFGGVFNTQYQMVTAGPAIRVSGRDTLNFDYQFTDASFDIGGPASNFRTQGATIGWSRILSPTITANIAGGATMIEPGKDLQHLINASIAWNYRRTTSSISYSRSVFPSFMISPVPLVSQLVMVSISQDLTGHLTGTVTANYAHNEDSQSIVVFDSYAATLGLSYRISREFTAAFSYGYSDYTQRFSGQDFSFDRNVVTLSLRGEWN